MFIKKQIVYDIGQNESFGFSTQQPLQSRRVVNEEIRAILLHIAQL